MANACCHASTNPGRRKKSCVDAIGQSLPLADEPILKLTDLLDPPIEILICHVADTSLATILRRGSLIGRPYGMAAGKSAQGWQTSIQADL